MVFVTTPGLCCSSAKVVIDEMERIECVCVPGEVGLQKKAGGWIGPMDCSFLDFG